ALVEKNVVSRPQQAFDRFLKEGKRAFVKFEGLGLKETIEVIQRLFDPILALSEKGWKNLNFAWAAMFVVMSGLHVFFAFLFHGGKYWGEFTAFGDMIVMFSFIIIQFIILRKHFKSPDA
ncbi:septation protein IspZ, partial [Acinetobacter baumannii]|uniref:septation protein IspZ n=1 Tax=Acinetobacter baumannii TaxID=470 RepID=UPI001CB82881